ncbi:hypothetical protein [Neorhizobium galegae]|uniref:hypothetical protein n=1 Tax=Neorhizobium galegae TaxID=399 RepID=UPI0012FEC8C6|nr:hypothetical protein [Neorhizobium galegae]
MLKQLPRRPHRDKHLDRSSQLQGLFGNISPEMKVFYGIVQSWRVQWWEGESDFEERLLVAHRFPLVGASRELFCEFGRELLQKTWNAQSL